jgi:biotin-(acetyl-CoA carboxylase) ligase
LVEKVQDKICIGMGVNYFWETPPVPNAGSIFNAFQDETKLKEDAKNWAIQLEEIIKENKFDLNEYKSRLQTIGKLVEYPEGRGWAEDVNKDGSLRIKTVDEKTINLTSPLITEVN